MLGIGVDPAVLTSPVFRSFFFFLKLKRQIKMVDYLMQSTQIFVVLINSGNLNCGFV